MNTLFPQRARSLFADSALGGLGVDQGERCLKLVQLGREGTRSVFDALHVIAREPNEPVGDHLARGMQEWSALDHTATAGLLPPTLLQRRSCELPEIAESETSENDIPMVMQELAWEVPEISDYEVTCLPNALPASLPHLRTVAAWFLRSDAATEFAMTLRETGHLCHMLPPRSVVTARALDLLPEQFSNALVIDLGWSRTELTFVRDGQPIHERDLPEAGIDRWFARVSRRFGLSIEATGDLLSRYGLPDLLDDRPDPVTGSLRSALLDLLESSLLRLIASVRETLIYADRMLRGFRPETIVLIGGGATVPHLDQVIATGTDLPTMIWNLSSRTTGQPPDHGPVFAHAAALSSLLRDSP